MKRIKPLDLFLVFIVILAALTFYFSFVKPIQFSHLIRREGVTRYATVEILLPEDLSWMKDSIPLGEEYRNVYGELDWKIIAAEETALSGKALVKVTAKILITQESSGLLRYGKYTLVRGSKIFLINDRLFIEGRLLSVQLLDERIEL